MKKLLPNRVNSTYTPDEMKVINDLYDALETKIKSPPIISDAEFKALSKMGDVKRIEAGKKLAVFMIHSSFLPPNVRPELIQTDVTLFDQTQHFQNRSNAIMAKAWRSGDIAGAEAMNALSYAEEQARISAGAGDNDDALEAVNKLDRINDERVANTPKPPPPNNGDAKDKKD
jgi:hypothetical protein